MQHHSPTPMKHQLALAISLNDEATLADYCWHGNEILHQQLMQTLAGTGERILYLWGGQGSGKSHLLQGCCQTISKDQSAIYLPLETLKSWGTCVLEGVDTQDLICLDDIEAIAGNKDWEEAVFHLYNRIKDNDSRCLIISGRYPIHQLPIVLPDLRSRLAWGFVSQVHTLPDEAKINALLQQAQKRGMVINHSVGQFLLNRCSRDMHQLHDILNRLDEASLAAQRKITIPFVKSILAL